MSLRPRGNPNSKADRPALLGKKTNGQIRDRKQKRPGNTKAQIKNLIVI
ncbi:MAG: hypothetical protein ACTSQ8_24605 [Candidatus Helarchaeota archaeon]